MNAVKNNQTKNGTKGFTLSELMITALILAFALTSILLLFMNCIVLNESNRNFTIAYSAIQTKMEELKNSGFDNLPATGTSFDLNGFPVDNGKLRIEITDESTTLKRVEITACFRNRNRIIGDDITNCLTSPVELVTQIADEE